MNLVSVDDGRIAGSPIDASCAGATLGVRPEAISFAANGDGVPATVSSTEYLGADLVLRCQIGSQQLLVRADGRHRAQPGDIVHLRWGSADAHTFDAHGHRVP